MIRLRREGLARLPAEKIVTRRPAVNKLPAAPARPTNPPRAEYFPDGYASSSASRQDAAKGAYIFVHSTAVRDPGAGCGSDFTQVTYARYAGDVTYHCAATYRLYHASGGGVDADDGYSYNYDDGGSQGIFTPFGSQNGLDVTLAGAAGPAVSAAPPVALNPAEFNNAGNCCWDYTCGFSRGRNCYESSYVTRSMEGCAQEYGNE